MRRYTDVAVIHLSWVHIGDKLNMTSVSVYLEKTSLQHCKSMSIPADLWLGNGGIYYTPLVTGSLVIC